MVPPAYLIELLRATRGAVRADVYTASAWARRLGDDPVFAASGSKALNWVPADELPALYEAHDCLLSIGELPGRQLSSKIFGYMATGKPVVHIYHAEGDANLPPVFTNSYAEEPGTPGTPENPGTPGGGSGGGSDSGSGGSSGGDGSKGGMPDTGDRSLPVEALAATAGIGALAVAGGAVLYRRRR